MSEEKPLYLVTPVPGLEDLELEPVPIPADETLRAFLLRMTGNDYDYLEERTWEELREVGAIENIMRMVQISSRPSIMFRLKRVNENDL